MKRKAKAILLLWTMAGLLAGCHRQDAIENTIENTDEQLTYRADDPVETEVGGNEIGNNTEPSEETEVQETEEDSAESTGHRNRRCGIRFLLHCIDGGYQGAHHGKFLSRYAGAAADFL